MTRSRDAQGLGLTADAARYLRTLLRRPLGALALNLIIDQQLHTVPLRSLIPVLNGNHRKERRCLCWRRMRRPMKILQSTNNFSDSKISVRNDTLPVFKSVEMNIPFEETSLQQIRGELARVISPSS